MSDPIRGVDTRPDARPDARRESSPRQRIVWDESRVCDYARWRYDEVDRLIAKAREIGRSLLTAQTVVLFGVLGVEAKAGIFGPAPQDFLVTALAMLSAIGLVIGVIVAAWVSFWAEDAPTPPSPQVLVDRFLDPDRDVVAVEVSKSLAQAYERGKEFQDRLHGRLRISIWCSALGIGGFVALFLIIAAKYPVLHHQVFGGAPSQPSPSASAAAAPPSSASAPPATVAPGASGPTSGPVPPAASPGTPRP